MKIRADIKGSHNCKNKIFYMAEENMNPTKQIEKQNLN